MPVEAIVVETLLNSGSENICLPAVHKVAVEAEASRVSVCKDELTTLGLDDVIDSVDNFEEQVRKLARMSWRADTIVNLRHVCNVTLVRLIVSSVPTRRELDLSSHAVVAIGAPHVVLFLGGTRAIKAREADTI